MGRNYLLFAFTSWYNWELVPIPTVWALTWLGHLSNTKANSGNNIAKFSTYFIKTVIPISLDFIIQQSYKTFTIYKNK